MTLLDTTSAGSPTGLIVRAGDSDWDALRATFNILDDQRPAAIAAPTDEREVAAAIAFARERGWRVAAQGTGHNAGPLGPLDDVLILNTSRLSGVEIDPEARRVRVGAAAKWGDVVPQLSDLGLAAIHGSSPDVGIVGFSLGGGIGWLSRKHGLQSSHVTAIELVTSEGHLVRADAQHEPDLFWALRGGNGNFGVVTALEFAVLPIASMYAGAMIFPAERGEDVFRAWRGILPTAPEELMTWAMVVNVPPVPTVPEPLRGRTLVIVFGVFLGEDADGWRLLESVRALGPEIDTFGTVPPAALGDLAMDPRDPLPYLSRTAIVDELDEEVTGTVLDLARRPQSPLTMVQFRHMGGALSRAPEGAGARATLPAGVLAYVNSVVPSPALAPAVSAAADAIAAALAPRKVGDYPNFVEQQADVSAFFDDETWARLRRVKALYDPADLFLGNHRIPPEA